MFMLFIISLYSETIQGGLKVPEVSFPLDFTFGSLIKMQSPVAVTLNAGFNIVTINVVTINIVSLISDFKRHVHLMQTVIINIK
jgi:hypothetical protein